MDRPQQRRIVSVHDVFNIQRMTRHVGTAKPSDRRKLIRYAETYLKECEKQDAQLPFLRRPVNSFE
jgi:hypothetical protein